MNINAILFLGMIFVFMDNIEFRSTKGFYRQSTGDTVLEKNNLIAVVNLTLKVFSKLKTLCSVSCILHSFT